MLLARDNFDRPDGIIAPAGGSWADGTSEVVVKYSISSGKAVASGGADTSSVWIARPQFPADQWAEVIVTVSTGSNGDGTGFGPCLRHSTSARTYYRMVINAAAANQKPCEIGRQVAGVWTGLATIDLPMTLRSGIDRFRLEIRGSTLRGFMNGRLIPGSEITDGSPITTGFPGIAYSSTATGAVDAFRAGALPYSGPLIVPRGMRRR